MDITCLGTQKLLNNISQIDPYVIADMSNAVSNRRSFQRPNRVSETTQHSVMEGHLPRREKIVNYNPKHEQSNNRSHTSQNINPINNYQDRHGNEPQSPKAAQNPTHLPQGPNTTTSLSQTTEPVPISKPTYNWLPPYSVQSTTQVPCKPNHILSHQQPIWDYNHSTNFCQPGTYVTSIQQWCSLCGMQGHTWDKCRRSVGLQCFGCWNRIMQPPTGPGQSVWYR